MKFQAQVELHGKTATGIEVPATVVEGLGSGKRPSVRVQIGAHSYQTTVAPRGDRFLIPVSAENREAAGVNAGDTVEVEVVLDDKPRELAVPAAFAQALKRDRGAQSFFDGLSYSHRRAYVLWIEDAKKAETRTRRIEQAVGMLHEGRTRS